MSFMENIGNPNKNNKRKKKQDIIKSTKPDVKQNKDEDGDADVKMNDNVKDGSQSAR